MSDPTERVRLQIFAKLETRQTLKSVAPKLGLDMSELGTIILDHILGLMEQGKTPADLKKAIEQYKKARDEAERASD